MMQSNRQGQWVHVNVKSKAVEICTIFSPELLFFQSFFFLHVAMPLHGGLTRIPGISGLHLPRSAM